jgi:hypothetical protein
VTSEVRIHYAHSLDPESWAARHAAGQVPDRWPYGLNHLSQYFPEVVSVRPPTGTGAILARLVRKTCGGYQWMSPGVSAASDIAIAWDERAGLPVANRLGTTIPVIFGVIWLTEPSRASHWTDRIARQAFRLGTVLCSGPGRARVLAYRPHKSSPPAIRRGRRILDPVRGTAARAGDRCRQ